jgi:hypothetical protein
MVKVKEIKSYIMAQRPTDASFDIAANMDAPGRLF